MTLFSFRSACSRQGLGYAPRLAVALCFSTALTAGALVAPAFAQPAREAPPAVKDAKEAAKDAKDAAKDAAKAAKDAARDAKEAAKDARAEAREKRETAKEAVHQKREAAQQKREAADKEDARERPGRGREERARGDERTPAAERPDRKPAEAQTSKPADKPTDKPAAKSDAPQAKPEASSRRSGDQPAARSDETRRPGDRDAAQERGRERDRGGDRASGRDRDRGERDRERDRDGDRASGRDHDRDRDRGDRDRARDDRGDRGRDRGDMGRDRDDRGRDRDDRGRDRGEAGDRDARRGSGPDAIRDVRSQRRERTENGRTVIVEPDRREITREGDRLIIRHDEAERFRRLHRDARVERGPGGVTRTIVTRPNGVRIITVTDERGRLVRRIRREPNGREIVIIDNRRSDRGPQRGFIEIAPPRITIPRERYILETDRARPQDVLEVLRAPPVQAVDRAYTLEEIRQTPNLRARMPRVDLDTITFDTGSWEIERAQARMLEAVANGMKNIIERNPDEVFLIEGHTDAVGSDVDNLSLSDRRAESVALMLTEEFGVPPENLTTQGFGEEQLKVQTEGAERANRRVTVRRITPLLQGQRTR